MSCKHEICFFNCPLFSTVSSGAINLQHIFCLSIQVNVNQSNKDYICCKADVYFTKDFLDCKNNSLCVLFFFSVATWWCVSAGMPFPPRGRPSNSWWRSWTECCCLSLTRWVSLTFMHPLPPMKPHADMHVVTMVLMRVFFLCCPDVFSVVSGIWGLWTPNNKNNWITLCLATATQIAQISERSIAILESTLNSISTAVYRHKLSQLMSLF